MKRLVVIVFSVLSVTAFAQQDFGPGSGANITAGVAGKEGGIGGATSSIFVNQGDASIESLNSVTIRGLDFGYAGTLIIGVVHVPTNRFAFLYSGSGVEAVELHGDYTFVVDEGLLTLP